MSPGHIQGMSDHEWVDIYCLHKQNINIRDKKKNGEQ